MNLLRIDSVDKTFIPDDFLSLLSRTFRIPDEPASYSSGIENFLLKPPCIDSVDKHSIQCIVCFDLCIDSVDKHSIQCIVCFDLCIDSVDKQDTIHNT